ncbi:MAG TPA: hypothetical protein VFA09_01515, partial [Ktedonobacteraceae bacterium]|nr:hypothetical protein [Ktedonobacteraceae bacterium]
FISLGQSLMQVFILLSKLKQFFFWRHALTLQDVELFGKSLGHLSSYKNCKIACRDFLIPPAFLEKPGDYP